MGFSRVSLLKSEVVGQTPTASAMASGELAVNYADKKIYGKHPGSGVVVQVAASPNEVIVKNSSDTTPVNSVRTMSQAEYAALGSYDANTLYFATGTPQAHYTEAETDALLAGKSDTGHTHTVSEVSGAVENVSGVSKIERVTAMPASPDPNTLYIVIP